MTHRSQYWGSTIEILMAMGIIPCWGNDLAAQSRGVARQTVVQPVRKCISLTLHVNRRAKRMITRFAHPPKSMQKMVYDLLCLTGLSSSSPSSASSSVS